MDVPCRDLEPIKKDHLSFIEDYQTGLAPPDKSARYANKRQAFAGNIQRKFFNKVRKGEKEEAPKKGFIPEFSWLTDAAYSGCIVASFPSCTLQTAPCLVLAIAPMSVQLLPFPQGTGLDPLNS